jgi:hypothetical protein
MRNVPKLKYKAVHWEDANGWFELRFHGPGETGPFVTGHWRSHFFATGEVDTGYIVDKQAQMDEAELARITVKSPTPADFREECLLAIGREYDTTFFEEMEGSL